MSSTRLGKEIGITPCLQRDRNDNAVAFQPWIADLLQWGRDCLAAERQWVTAEQPLGKSLQCGRGRTATESNLGSYANQTLKMISWNAVIRQPLGKSKCAGCATN